MGRMPTALALNPSRQLYTTKVCKVRGGEQLDQIVQTVLNNGCPRYFVHKIIPISTEVGAELHVKVRFLGTARVRYSIVGRRKCY